MIDFYKEIKSISIGPYKISLQRYDADLAVKWKEESKRADQDCECNCSDCNK